MAIDFSPIILVVVVSSIVAFIATYLLASYFINKDGSSDVSPPKSKKISSAAMSLLNQDLWETLRQSDTVNSLPPDLLVTLQHIIQNNHLKLKKAGKNREKIKEILKSYRQEIEEWIVSLGPSNFDISKSVYDAFFDWLFKLENELA